MTVSCLVATDSDGDPINCADTYDSFACNASEYCWWDDDEKICTDKSI